MKKTLIIIGLLAFLLIGCNQTIENKGQKDNNEQLKQDSIAAVEEEQSRIEQAKQDSILTIEQKKVIGAILFGMTEKVVKSNIEEFKKENRKPDEILGKRYYDYFIGNYEFISIHDLYYQDKLYKIIIYGKPIPWEYFDSEAPRQIKAISDVLRAKYGKPTTHYDLEPRYKLKRNYTYLIDSWNVGNKEIQVRISDKGTSYWVNVVITKPEIENKINQEQREKENKETQKGKDVF